MLTMLKRCALAGLLVSAGLALAACPAGCKDKRGSSGGDGGTQPTAAGSTAVPVHPEAGDVKAVIVSLMEAGQRGDATAAKKLCMPAMYAQMKLTGPRKLEFDVRQVRVFSKSAEAVVWVKSLQITDTHNEHLMTYTLDRTGDGWKVSGVTRKSYWPAPSATRAANGEAP